MNAAALSDLRAKIDAADRELLAVLERRFTLCHEVAALKGDVQTQVLQPERVRDVLRTRVAWARECSIDPEFAELLFRSLLSETHRIEAVHMRAAEPVPVSGSPVPGSVGPYVDSALQATACRVVTYHRIGKPMPISCR